MKDQSYFKYKLEDIKISEEKKWNFMESKKYHKIIKKYIKAVEDKKVKKRYTAPFSQAFFIQLCRMIGM